MNEVRRIRWALVFLLVFVPFSPAEPVAAQRQIVYGGFNASNDAVSLFNQGTALLRSNRNQEAKEKFERALNLSPNFAEAHHELAVALLKLDRRDDAIEQFQQAIKLDPSLAASWLSLAGAYQACGRVTDAIAGYRNFLSRFPNDDDVPRVRNLIALLEKESIESANAINP